MEPPIALFQVLLSFLYVFFRWQSMKLYLSIISTIGYPSLIASIPGSIVGIFFGALMIAIAVFLPLNLLGQPNKSKDQEI